MTLSLYVTIGICVAIAILGLIFHARWTARSVMQGPALLTMLGIAGTFFGIAAGLHNFDANDIQHSIPGLIDGMRTAVWASLVGILFAISIKLRYALAREQHVEDEGKSDAELIATQLLALQKSIAGDDEATVISQMKLARSDMNDRLDALKRSQSEFMEKLAEMSSKTLVEALRDVIRDFNTNLTEQFGDNFKELNAAVHKLVEWQEQYRQSLDALIEVERESASHLEQAVSQHKEVLSTSESLITVANSFRDILQGADAYKATLKQNTELLASLVEQIRTDVPVLQEEITELVDTIADTVSRHEADISRLSTEISERFKQAADAVQNDLTAALTTANKEIADNVGKLVGSTKEQTEALQTALEETLNESLRTLGQQLASLSSKFAEDYGPITDRLRDIVGIGRVAS
jgi:hypothetical protein